jgi:acetoin utilization protein AcuB
MLVRDRMSICVVTVRSDANYMAGIKLMQDNAMHHLPVVDSGGRLVGILAERDLLIAATQYLQAPVEVSEIMHRGVVTADPDMPINEAARLMAHHKIGGLPVLEDGRKLVGIITETDILRTFIETPH